MRHSHTCGWPGAPQFRGNLSRRKAEGVFREVDFNSESKLGQTRDRNARLKLLLQDFADPRLDLRPSVVGAEDVIGNVYEYLLERFASDAGKKAGEFYTPGRVSSLLARLLAPKKGRDDLRSGLRFRFALDQGGPRGR